MNPTLTRSLFAGMMLGLAACTSTQLESDWKAPAVGSLQFSKVLVIAAAPDNATRRSAEDAIRSRIAGVPVVASYELVPEMADVRDRAKVAAAMQASGVDGVVVLRLVSDDSELVYTPGAPMPMPYRSFWGYYARPYALRPFYGWETGTVSTDRVIGIETNIYSVKDEGLVWSGLTRTRNPSSLDQTIGEVAEVVRARLQAQKLIP